MHAPLPFLRAGRPIHAPVKSSLGNGNLQGAGWGSCDSTVTHHVSMRGVRCPRDQHGTTTELPWPVPRHVLRGYHPASQSDSERQLLATAAAPARPRVHAGAREWARAGGPGCARRGGDAARRVSQSQSRAHPRCAQPPGRQPPPQPRAPRRNRYAPGPYRGARQ